MYHFWSGLTAFEFCLSDYKAGSICRQTLLMSEILGTHLFFINEKRGEIHSQRNNLSSETEIICGFPFICPSLLQTVFNLPNQEENQVQNCL